MRLNSRVYKLVCSVCLLLSTSALVMIARAPASGYEVSIYTTNLSPLVWVLLLTSMGGSIFLLVSQARDAERQENNRWLIPFFILAFNSLIVLLMPELKGYYSSSRGDALTHIGYIRDIMFMGHFPIQDIYPAQHLFPAMLAQITGLSARSVASYIPPFTSAGYVLFIYLLAKTIFHNRGTIILACASGAILLMPHSGLLEASRPAALMFPLVLVLFFRWRENKSFGNKILFILILILIPFIHPLATLIMLLTLVVASLVQVGYNIAHKEELTQEVPLNYLFILSVVSFLWYVDLFIFKTGVAFIKSLLIFSTTASPVTMVGLLLEKGGVYGVGIIRLLFKLYGGEIIYGILALISVVMVARRLFFHQHQERKIVIFSSLFVTLCLAYLMYWLGFSFGYGETYGRLIFYIPVISILLASPILYQVIRMPRFRGLLSVLVACLILISATFSVFNKYTSTYTHGPNPQATYMEIEGADWIVNYRDLSIKPTYIGTSLYRFSVAKNGIYWFHQSPVPFDANFPKPPVRIPDHFGYQYQDTIGESVPESVYLVLTKWDWVLYEEIWKLPIPTRWGREDFERLEHDPTVDKLYANGEFEVWFVRSVTSPAMSQQE